MSFTKTYSHFGSYWKQTTDFLFNELILSWNGKRPNGSWRFFVRIEDDDPLLVAQWSNTGQQSFCSYAKWSQNEQDIITCKKLCNRFEVIVEGDELEKLHSLSVCLSNLNAYKIKAIEYLPPIFLQNVPRQSQLTLSHPRNKDLCSPTSISIALSYLLQKRIDPLDFALRAYDQGFDIYGNWALNIAESYHQSGIGCRVERLADFHALYERLLENLPVVVSVKGKMQGSAKEYTQGHLLCVIGYSKANIQCIVPAFDQNENTLVSYPIDDFLSAWGKRYNLAYTFFKREMSR